MDQTQDPCQDFFQFACGTWNKKHVIPEDRSSISTFEVSNRIKYTTYLYSNQSSLFPQRQSLLHFLMDFSLNLNKVMQTENRQFSFFSSHLYYLAFMTTINLKKRTCSKMNITYSVLYFFLYYKNQSITSRSITN